MTYCFAWKYQDAVCLIADTLMTQGVPAGADRRTTSMGEPHRQLRRDEFVEERLLKIREIKGGASLAIAGDVLLALEIADFIEDNIGSFETVADVFPAVEATFAPFDPKRRVQILLVQGKENGECFITRWDTVAGRQDAALWSYIGFLAPERAHAIAETFQRIVTNSLQSSKEGVLLAGMALVLSYSQHEDLISQHVGGVVCGLRVQRGKTIWPDDLIILLHKDKLEIPGERISVHARDGSVFVHSTYHQAQGSLFVNKHESVSTEQLREMWNERWWPYLKEYPSERFTDCTRWIFINCDQPVALALVNHGRPEQASRHIRFTKDKENNTTLSIGDELSEALKRKRLSAAPEVRIVDVVIPGEPLPDGVVAPQSEVASTAPFTTPSTLDH